MVEILDLVTKSRPMVKKSKRTNLLGVMSNGGLAFF